MASRSFSSWVLGKLAAALLLPALISPAAAAADDVAIPGGSAAIRRLLGLSEGRPPDTFFLEVHQTLVSDCDVHASWDKVERRQRVVSFVSDLADWRKEFGETAVFSAKADWKKARRALLWLGFKVQGGADDFQLAPKDGADDQRRQGFLEVLGVSLGDFQTKLLARESVTITTADDAMPLPFGFAAWRETLDLTEKELATASAFLIFVKNVRASRLLVALHDLDGQTRESLRALVIDKGGRSAGWRFLYDEALDGLTRFPEALTLRRNAFVLPGGEAAVPVWTDVLGVAPAEKLKFLAALYQTDVGKAAYVVDALNQPPPDRARALILGKTGGGPAATKRFRKLYDAIEKSNAQRFLRDPYDFTHLVRFLVVDDGGALQVPGGSALWLEALASSDLPRSGAELETLLKSARNRHADPEELLRRLFRKEGTLKEDPPAKRFLVVSSLVGKRPALAEPGVVLLLARGTTRYLGAYGPLEDLALTPEDARRYLFTLVRLDARSERHLDEIRTGLLQASAEVLSAMGRSRALASDELSGLFRKLLSVPLFLSEKPEPSEIFGYLSWLDGDLVSALARVERDSVGKKRAEKERRESAYRAAALARNERVRRRLGDARASLEESRAAADARVRDLMSPECPPDDRLYGPFPPRWIALRAFLATSIARQGPSALAPEDEAQIAINQAVAAERRRATPLPPPLEPPSVDGDVPGVTLLVDPDEPFPTFVPIVVPETSASSDDLLSAALVGSADTASFTWRGGRYRYDPAADLSGRRKEFRDRQRIAQLANLRRATPARDALLKEAAAGHLAEATKAANELAEALELLSPGGAAIVPSTTEPRLLEEENAAADAATTLLTTSNARGLSSVPERLAPLETLAGRRALEALVGSLYALFAGDPSDLYYQDPDFVRRHSFRWSERAGRIVETPWSNAALRDPAEAGGVGVSGALSGLPEVLGLLHVDQLVYQPGASIPNDAVRTGLVGPIARVSPARMDDEAIRFVDEVCRATEELVEALSPRTEKERVDVWESLARDLVPRARLNRLARIGTTQELSRQPDVLSPSDLYAIGKRLVSGPLPDGTAVPSAAAARRTRAALAARHGGDGALERLAELGPRPLTYAGELRLTDMDLPSYERLAEYRFPQLFADRLFDLKIAAARLLVHEKLPAGLLPIVLPVLLDTMLSQVRMVYAYDWSAVVREIAKLSVKDVDRALEAGLSAGRIRRAEAAGDFEER